MESTELDAATITAAQNLLDFSQNKVENNNNITNEVTVEDPNDEEQGKPESFAETLN